MDPVLCYLKKNLASHDVLFDVGAHDLSWAVTLSPTAGRIVCFEPALDHIDHVSTKECKNVFISQLALSDLDGKIVEMAVGTGSEDIYVTSGSKDAMCTALTARLDTIYRIYGFPTVLKIDVQGYEEKVLYGMVPFWPMPKLRIVMEYCPMCLDRAGVDVKQFTNDLFYYFDVLELSGGKEGVAYPVDKDELFERLDGSPNHTDLLMKFKLI